MPSSKLGLIAIAAKITAETAAGKINCDQLTTIFDPTLTVLTAQHRVDHWLTAT